MFCHVATHLVQQDTLCHEPRHDKTCFCHMLPYATNKAADQPAHPRSVISAFVVRCLDSIIHFSFYIRSFKPLSSFRGCAGRFESTLVSNLEDRFSRDEALILPNIAFNRFFQRPCDERGGSQQTSECKWSA